MRHEAEKVKAGYVLHEQAISELLGVTEVWCSQFYLQPDISEHTPP